VEISIARKCDASLGNSLLSWFPDRAINTSDDGCGAAIILHYIVLMPARSSFLSVFLSLCLIFDVGQLRKLCNYSGDCDSYIFLPFLRNNNDFEGNLGKILEDKRFPANYSTSYPRNPPIPLPVRGGKLLRRKSRDGHKPASVEGVRARGSWVTAASLESPQAR